MFIQDFAFGGRGSREQWSRLGGVLFSLEEAKIYRFFKLENFQKILKKSMKNFYFLKVLKEIKKPSGKILRVFAKNQ